MIYSVYRAHRSVSNRAEPRDIDDARPLTRRRWSGSMEWERGATRIREFDVVVVRRSGRNTTRVTLRSRESTNVSPGDAARGLVHWSAGRALAVQRRRWTFSLRLRLVEYRRRHRHPPRKAFLSWLLSSSRQPLPRAARRGIRLQMRLRERRLVARERRLRTRRRQDGDGNRGVRLDLIQISIIMISTSTYSV